MVPGYQWLARHKVNSYVGFRSDSVELDCARWSLDTDGSLATTSISYLGFRLGSYLGFRLGRRSPQRLSVI